MCTLAVVSRGVTGVYVRTYTCIHRCASTRAHAYAYIYIPAFMHIPACVHMYPCVRAQACGRGHPYVYTHIHTDTRDLSLNVGLLARLAVKASYEKRVGEIR